MRMMIRFFGIAVALAALSAGANAQTIIEFLGAGSSAQFLQLGRAAGTAIPTGLGAICVWSQSSGTPASVQATATFSAVTRSEAGNAWIAWQPTGGSCTATPGRGTQIYAMLQTDSVLGNMLYFNHGTLGAVGSSPAGSSSGGLIFGTSEVALNSGIWSAIVANPTLTAAVTDIRPEDAKFAMLRALTSCGTAVSGSQYLGLGYRNGDRILSAFGGSSPSSFDVLDFNLPIDGSYAVLPVGAVPVVVAVNPSNASGFGGLTFGGSTPANITRAELAHFLDGTSGHTSDVLGAGSGGHATPLIREPLSGTYNTMEYSAPNTSNLGGVSGELATSQDVGQNQLLGQSNCGTPSTPGGFVPAGGFSSTLNGYQMNIATNNDSSAFRKRVIGTGQSISELLVTSDAIGYAFWSTSNYQNATTSNARYLTVDGYDPLYNRTGSSYSTIANTLPTASSGHLSDVTFSDLQAGNYPIWSLLRLVTTSNTSSANYVAAHSLAFAAQNFVSTTTFPDWVPYNNGAVAPILTRLHSHFAPPGVTFSGTNTPANGASACTPEAGGDVGGVILSNTSCAINQRQ